MYTKTVKKIGLIYKLEPSFHNPDYATTTVFLLPPRKMHYR